MSRSRKRRRKNRGSAVEERNQKRRENKKALWEDDTKNKDQVVHWREGKPDGGIERRKSLAGVTEKRVDF